MMQLIEKFKNARVLVVGDVLLDRYWSGQTSRVSPEAPVPVVHVQDERHCPGGAANVAVNINAIGGQAQLLGLVGDDDPASQLREILSNQGVNHTLLPIDAPTIIKLRVLSRHQQLLRMDFEQNFSTINKETLLEHYNRALNNTDIVILSDYGKGTLQDTESFIKAAKAKNIPVLVDPKGRDFSRYQGASLITPNLKELTEVLGDHGQEEILFSEAKKLLSDINIPHMLLTRGAKGMTLLGQNEPPHSLSATAREVYDVTGAGDTVIAVMGAALASGANYEQAATIANIAAGIAVGKLGTAAARLSDLEAHFQSEPTKNLPTIVALKTLVKIRSQLHSSRKRLVMTNGCFDLLHKGHVSYLERAKALGDYLVVGVNTDPSVRRLKGTTRPITPLNDRMAVLSGLSAVDFVFSFDEDTPALAIEKIKPDILVKGGDYRLEDVVGAKEVLSAGGQVEILPFIEGCSTTKMVEKIKAEEVNL